MTKKATTAKRRGRKKAAKKRAPRKATPDPKEETKEVYAFPTRVVCPGCGCLNNYALSTRGGYQTRTCRTPKCEHNTAYPRREPFTVKGEIPKKPL